MSDTQDDNVSRWHRLLLWGVVLVVVLGTGGSLIEGAGRAKCDHFYRDNGQLSCSQPATVGWLIYDEGSSMPCQNTTHEVRTDVAHRRHLQDRDRTSLPPSVPVPPTGSFVLRYYKYKDGQGRLGCVVRRHLQARDEAEGTCTIDFTGTACLC